jgi:hypothetical protein
VAFSRSVAAGLCVLLVACSGWRERREVVERWLATDCGVGERGRLEARLRQLGPQLESALIEAFDHGPSSSALKLALASGGQNYDQVQARLQANKSDGLDQAEIAAIRAMSKKEHLARVQADYVYSFRAAALVGLAITRGAKGRELLRRLAADGQSPFQHVAELALQRSP